jgi:drug/metabolite transporter (DMT)-like permease
VLALLLSLGASLAWGVGDFVAGVAARRAGALAVTLLTQLVGAILAVGWVVADGEPPPSAHAVLLAAIAGAAVLLGLGVFYHALAIGTMNIVAPVAATGVVVPVVVDLVGGRRPSPLEASGMALAIAGVALAARRRTTPHVPDDGRAPRSVALALVAAAGGGVFLWLLAPAGRESVPWAVLVARGSAAPLFGLAVLGLRANLRPALRRGTGVPAVGAGALGFAAIALYTSAAQHGSLAVVAVLSSLYPAVTILLARTLLGERLNAAQRAGVTTVLVAVVLIGAG